MTREDATLHMILRREELKNSVGDLDKDIEAFDMAIQALEQTRWIPVSERLPEMHEVLGILKKLVYMRSDEVIVTIRDNKNGSVVTHSKCYLWEGKWHGDIFDWLKASKVDYEVIAWMPLPQPYKGESER